MRAMVALTNARSEALTVGTIARMGNFSRRTWYGGVEDLLFDLGFIERVESESDAKRYRARFGTAPVDGFRRFRAALGENAAVHRAPTGTPDASAEASCDSAN
jgi:hypothetical protein